LAQSKGEFMKGKTESSQHRYLPKSAGTNLWLFVCVCFSRVWIKIVSYEFFQGSPEVIALVMPF
jgi:hypothetical protein